MGLTVLVRNFTAVFNICSHHKSVAFSTVAIERNGRKARLAGDEDDGDTGCNLSTW